MMSDASPLPRFSASVAFAAAVTAALLWLMQDLIRHDGKIPGLIVPAATLTILRLPEPEPVIIREPEKLPEVIPPPVVDMETVTMEIGDGIGYGIVVPPGPDLHFTPKPGGLPDGDMLPIVKVAPNYPQRAAGRGIEGFVLLEFTVDETGAVRSPRIIESQPAGVFDHSALNAVLRFKYKPRVLNGAAVQVDGVLHRLVFELNDA